MDMKRDYYEDVQLFSSGVTLFWFIALLLFLAAFPFLFKNYYVYVANYIAINVLVAIGLNLLVGYTGQISLGHAGFFAVGAYGTIVFMAKLHLPFLITLPLGGLTAALLGFLLGLPACSRDTLRTPEQPQKLSRTNGFTPETWEKSTMTAI
jgi:branched-chain amino acid transport system permease protein